MVLRPLGRFLIHAAGVAALSLVLAVLLFHVVLQPFQVAGLSMRPTLAERDYLLVDRVFFRLADLSRGDLVVFRSPLDDRFLVKRLAALPGDRLDVTPDGRLRVNGLAVTPPGAASSAGPLRVPEGRYFFLGDNLPQSQDSRDFGTVPGEAIRGRVLCRYFPPSLLRTPAPTGVAAGPGAVP